MRNLLGLLLYVSCSVTEGGVNTGKTDAFGSGRRMHSNAPPFHPIISSSLEPLTFGFCKCKIGVHNPDRRMGLLSCIVMHTRYTSCRKKANSPTWPPDTTSPPSHQATTSVVFFFLN